MHDYRRLPFVRLFAMGSRLAVKSLECLRPWEHRFFLSPLCASIRSVLASGEEYLMSFIILTAWIEIYAYIKL